MIYGLESATEKEREYINLCYTEFGYPCKLNEDDEILMTDNIVSVVEFLGYDASRLTYEETDKVVQNAQNVWFDNKNSLRYFIIKNSKK